MCIIEAIEGFFSFILGIFIGIFVGIGFLFRAVYLMLKYLIGKLIGVIRPSAKYRIRLKWLLRDAEREKNAVLHTGLFSKYELQGGETDRVFKDVKRCMARYAEQKKRRSEIGDRSVLGSIFEKIDGLYNAFLKQFWLAAETIDWKRLDAYSAAQHPGFASMRKAVKGLETLLNEQDKTLSGAAAQNVQDGVDLHSIEQDLEFVQNFNAAQASESEQTGQTQQM